MSKYDQYTENDVTPKELFLNRKQFIKNASKTMLMGTVLGGAIANFSNELLADQGYHSKALKTKITPKKAALSYNNFYEFSTDKSDVASLAKNFKTDPWHVDITGHVEKSFQLSVADLKVQMPIEERIYRFRCVEAWSMVVPWTGFSLKHLIKIAKPTSKAKYIKFTTLNDSNQMPGIKRLFSYPWPYTEGLRMDEAMNDLTMLATGIYGQDLPPQNGAPIRLVVPWKYGFKSIKSIVKIEFVEKQPTSLWMDLGPREYGFYANVNPNHSHPRWSQAKERVIGGGFFAKKIPTQMFNGYQKEVAHIYKGMDLRQYF